MTPKEKIYAQIIDVQNEERKILGLVPIDKEKSLASGFARNHTIKELEEDLAIAYHRLATTKRQAKIDAFYQTEAGIAYKSELEARRESLLAKYTDSQTATLRKVREFLDKTVGSEWKIQGFGDTSFALQLCNDSGKDLFGHDIDFHYSSRESRFKMNYGSIGSFDPTADPCRSAYLKGMATLADPVIAQELKGILMDYAKTCNRIRSEEYDINTDLQNPPIDE